jgi:hypothetical protein
MLTIYGFAISFKIAIKLKIEEFRIAREEETSAGRL